MECIMFPFPLALGAQGPILCSNTFILFFSYMIIPLLAYVLTFVCFKDLFQLCFMLFPLQTLQVVRV